MCLPRPALIGIISRLMSDYRNTRSGFPDLTLWNVANRTVVVCLGNLFVISLSHFIQIVEVKGPGDSLSSKQRLWLHYFNTLGVRAEVCHVQGNLFL